MLERLEYYRQQRDHARKLAESGEGNPAAWQRIADEWQKLIDALSDDLAEKYNPEPK
jgi:hypothetical protein